MYAQGRVVWEHPELDALVAEARALYVAGPAPRPLTPQARHALIDELLDARALATGSDPRHVLVAVGAAHGVVEGLYATRGWWGVKRERWLADLQEREPGAAQEVLDVLTAAEARVRQAALEALTRRLTGDLQYRDGQSEPQRVE
ncbi:hypothetical protein CVO96_14670 [Deinococcus koreensis]|uniref:Uncharacterized protein n=2 Tax=Deinococcus koreensis TaxID=2054903 RepID=A0A2K3V2T4_9DEIO|nr:hypothetical protein CVO96_14670 [Deinococcus koreensis]